jgi:CheY-like chemotaxis protein
MVTLLAPHPLRVLIADGNPGIRDGLVSFLRHLSAATRIHQVQDGRMALAALSKDVYDLIVTELDMDGGSGEAFMKHLMASKLLRHKATIVYSNKEFDDGPYDNIIYINKTLTPIAELERIIKELVFKNFICPRCPESIAGGPCNDICFYTHLDQKWRSKVREFLA